MVQCSMHKRLALAICNTHFALLLIAPFDSSTKTQSGTLRSEDAHFCKSKCWRHAENKISCLCCFNILGSQKQQVGCYELSRCCGLGIHTKRSYVDSELDELGLAALVQQLLLLRASHAKLSKRACRTEMEAGTERLA